MKTYQIKNSESEYCFVSIYHPSLHTTQSCSQIRIHTPTRYGHAQGLLTTVTAGGKAVSTFDNNLARSKGILNSIIEAYLVVKSGPQRDFKDRYSVFYQSWKLTQTRRQDDTVLSCRGKMLLLKEFKESHYFKLPFSSWGEV